MCSQNIFLSGNSSLTTCSCYNYHFIYCLFTRLGAGLSWASVMDYIKNLKKAGAQNETPDQINAIDTDIPETIQTSQKDKCDPIEEVPLRAANLQEMLI